MTNRLSSHFPRSFASNSNSSFFFPDCPIEYPSKPSSSSFLLSLNDSMTETSFSLQYQKSSFAQFVLSEAGQITTTESKLPSIAATDKEVVSHTPNVGVMADTVAMIADMEAEISRQSAENVLMEGQAYLLLNKLPPEYSSLLIDHYMKGKKITEICKTTHLEQRWTKKKIASALAKFQCILDHGDI